MISYSRANGAGLLAFFCVSPLARDGRAATLCTPSATYQSLFRENVRPGSTRLPLLACATIACMNFNSAASWCPAAPEP